MGLRIIFMGTPDFSVPVLSGLLGAGHDVVGVYTQPPRAAGRGQKERLSPVHAFAADAGLPVLTRSTLKGRAEQDEFASLEPDVAVVVAYGLILPKAILEAPKMGCLNCHASLLPRWRGAAPLQRAIMAGDTQSGVMVMRMEEGLDTGPVCMVEYLDITQNMTAGELHDALAPLGADLMVRALSALERGTLVCSAQSEEGITYASKIDKSESRIDWSRPAPEVHNHIRGLSPFPGAWFELEHKGRTERVKVLRSVRAEGQGVPGMVLDDQITIACATGAIRLTHLQRAGKKPMGSDEFLRGAAIECGMALTG